METALTKSYTGGGDMVLTDDQKGLFYKSRALRKAAPIAGAAPADKEERK